MTSSLEPRPVVGMPLSPHGCLDHGQDSLQAVAERLAGQHGVFWLLGASCTGKTTVCRRLAETCNVTLCDMDARIFGEYVGKYDETRHPASCAWLKRPDGLQWVLSLSWDEFNRLNEAAGAEILDLFAQELLVSTEAHPLVVDGGLWHPRLLAQVLPVANVLCIQRDEAARAGTWERDENKLQMKSMILALPDGEQLWRTFLHFDEMIAKTLEDQCRAAGIRLVQTHEGRDGAEAAAAVAECWKLH